MKFSLVIYTFAAVIAMVFANFEDPDQNEIDKQWKLMEECSKETNTPLPEKLIPKEGEKPGVALLDMFKDAKYDCFNRCGFIKNGFMNEQNEIIWEYPASVADGNRKCMDDNTQDDKCVQAVRRVDCFFGLLGDFLPFSNDVEINKY